MQRGIMKAAAAARGAEEFVRDGNRGGRLDCQWFRSAAKDIANGNRDVL